MGRNHWIGLVFTAVSLFSLHPEWASAQDARAVRVVLHDSAAASGQLLAEAGDFAIGVFRDAGIDLAMAAGDERAACLSGVSDHFCVQVLLRARHPEFAPGKRQPPMGVALAASNKRAVVSVFLDVITEVARRYGLPVGKVLGIAVAHEIGHVMLPPPSHSTAGIMQPSWEGDDLRHAIGGDMAFTGAQGAVMRERLISRR